MTGRGRKAASLRVRRWVLAVAAAASTLCGCSSSYPTRASALQRSEAAIDATLDGLHYTGARVFELSEGACHESDASHGDLDILFHLPNTKTQDQMEALMSRIIAYWRSDPAFSALSSESPSSGYYADAVFNGTQVTAEAAYFTHGGGGVILDVSTCYSTPGPVIPTTSSATQPP
jgi:hypothetical protein